MISFNLEIVINYEVRRVNSEDPGTSGTLSYNTIAEYHRTLVDSCGDKSKQALTPPTLRD